jgi:hypothetical protein
VKDRGSSPDSRCGCGTRSGPNSGRPDPGLDRRTRGTLSSRATGSPSFAAWRRRRSRSARTLLARATADGRPLLASAGDLATIESVASRKVRSVARSCRARRAAARSTSKGGQVRSAREPRPLRAALDRALAHRHHGYGELIGRSKAMADVYFAIDRMAPAPYPVLIVGESGTGQGARRPRAPPQGAVCRDQLRRLPRPSRRLRGSSGHVRGAFTGAERDRAGLFEQAHGGIAVPGRGRLPVAGGPGVAAAVPRDRRDPPGRRPRDPRRSTSGSSPPPTRTSSSPTSSARTSSTA